MKAAIVGISGQSLTADEAALLAELRPLGVILFARNISDPGQVAALREALPEGVFMMVDQEGGRVARLRPPHWMGHPAVASIGALYAQDRTAGARAAWLQGALIGAECAAAGFGVVAAPVLDVGGTHDVIGDRSFSGDPATVAVLGGEMARGLLAGGVVPVGKHAPGHGRARADSHLELPVLEDVSENDLVPFRTNAWLPWMMTAHIRYTARDMMNPATHSAAVIGGVIRATGFDGVLVTDDLAMQALSGTPRERAARALAAGCDVALHCSGVFADTRDVLESVQDVDAGLRARLDAGFAMAGAARQALNLGALAAERVALLG